MAMLGLALAHQLQANVTRVQAGDPVLEARDQNLNFETNVKAWGL